MRVSSFVIGLVFRCSRPSVRSVAPVTSAHWPALVWGSDSIRFPYAQKPCSNLKFFPGGTQRLLGLRGGLRAVAAMSTSEVDGGVASTDKQPAKRKKSNAAEDELPKRRRTKKADTAIDAEVGETAPTVSKKQRVTAARDVVEEDDEPEHVRPVKVDVHQMVKHLEKELGMDERRVKGAVTLFQEGCTLPFIARYRKEQTGEMTEDELRKLEISMDRFQKLCDRKAAVLSSIEKAGQLSKELKKKIEQAPTLAEVEDLYLPFKPKKKTRASAARDQGLQKFADMILRKIPTPAGSPAQIAQKFVDPALGVKSVEDAMSGARDIVAEEVTEKPDVRAHARISLVQNLAVVSKERKKGADVAEKYKVYHQFESGFGNVRPHQVLAMLRGDKEGVLSIKLSVCPSRRDALVDWILSKAVSSTSHASRQWQDELRAAVADGVGRLLIPALEREWWRALGEQAQEASLQAFAANLRCKLLQPPLKGASVLAIDPGAASGCKVAIVDSLGKVLEALAVYPMRDADAAARRLLELLGRHGCSTIALGNGSYSRETERFLRERLLPKVPGLRFTVVDEAGASVYSASPLAVAELPSLDVTLRGAVSLARRLQDPLAEYVKIDPRSIGVGMYQHDMDQKRLAAELTQVVGLCVNAVGVDVNTASAALLRYISGLSSTVAAAIVRHREAQGPFGTRKDVGGVKGVGKKTLEQAAGFLRVYGGTEPLDSTPIHPESYAAARAAADRGAAARPTAELAAELGVGVETLKDIISALRAGPGTDPRETVLGIPPPPFLTSADTIGGPAGGAESSGESAVGGGAAVRAATTGLSAENLKVGSLYKGVVRNVVDFGVFVDIGVQTDGLVHISKLPRGRVLQVGAPVEVRVCAVTAPQGKASSGKLRISLSMVD